MAGRKTGTSKQLQIIYPAALWGKTLWIARLLLSA